tara:strand:+ start:54 stop:380 length:327 start_codon:yes stop_codon:yes gene_type:complete
MNKDTLFTVLLIAVIIIETGAQALLNQAAVGKNKQIIILGILAYVIVAYLYFRMLQTGRKVSLSNAIWNSGTIVLVSLVGYLMFNQPLNGRQILGIALALVAGFLMMT